MAEMTSSRLKMTVALPPYLIRQMKEWVKKEEWPSQSRFVERAVMDFLNHLRHEKLRQEFKRAARDPLFLKDIEETQKAFRNADRQAERGIH